LRFSRESCAPTAVNAEVIREASKDQGEEAAP